MFNSRFLIPSLFLAATPALAAQVVCDLTDKLGTKGTPYELAFETGAPRVYERFIGKTYDRNPWDEFKHVRKVYQRKVSPGESAATYSFDSTYLGEWRAELRRTPEGRWYLKPLRLDQATGNSVYKLIACAEREIAAPQERPFYCWSEYLRLNNGSVEGVKFKVTGSFAGAAPETEALRRARVLLVVPSPSIIKEKFIHNWNGVGYPEMFLGPDTRYPGYVGYRIGHATLSIPRDLATQDAAFTGYLNARALSGELPSGDFQLKCEPGEPISP
jgi:hypothetical protein